MTTPDVSRVWADGGLRRAPSDVKYKIGWIDEIPTYQVLNYLQWRNDVAQLAFAERGIPEWGADIDYTIGALAWDNTDNLAYKNITGGKTTIPPSTDPTNWVPSIVQLTEADLATSLASLNAHIADVDNPHGLTPASIGAYSIAEVDALITSNTADLTNHANDNTNPHGVTAEQIGAVPTTGGTYTGTVAFDAEETSYGGRDSAVRSNADGFYLRSGADLLGIDDVGVPNFNGSPLITSATFQEARAQDEPNYHVPTPDCNLVAYSDINLREGYGFTEYTSTLYPTPNQTDKGLEIQSGRDTFSIPAKDHMRGFHNLTIVFAGTQGTGDATTFFKDDSAHDNRLWATNTGEISVTLTNKVLTPKTYVVGVVPPGTRFRVAIVRSLSEVLIYLNGVLVVQEAEEFSTSIAYDNIIFGSLGTVYIEQFRTWARLLSAKQVTTL